VRCTREGRAATEAARLKALEAQKRAVAVVELKKAETRTALDRVLAAGDAAIDRSRAAAQAAQADGRTARLIELRRQGKTMAEAFEIIEREGTNG
jgi:hypothetical protein